MARLIRRDLTQDVVCAHDSAMTRVAENSPDPIEITPEMIDAGLIAYYERNGDIESDEEIVARIFTAMTVAFTKEERAGPAASQDKCRESHKTT